MITFSKKTVTISFEFMDRESPNQKGIFYRVTWVEMPRGYDVIMEYQSMEYKSLNYELWTPIGDRLQTFQFPTKKQSIAFLKPFIQANTNETS
jgi:hypothetical protein